MARRPLFDPVLPFPLRLSRRSIELYLECPRCYYLEARLGIKRPSIPSFTLNKAVDTLLKREFDSYRKRGKPHPFLLQNGVDAVPYPGSEIDEWRSVQKGIRVFLPEYNVALNGAPDEVLQTSDGRLIVVDYKSTAKKPDKTGMDLAGMYAEAYARQLSFYTFLLKKNGYRVSKEGYLLIENANTVSRKGFRSQLTFARHLVPIRINMAWIEPRVAEIYQVVSEKDAPPSSDRCEYCAFVHKCLVL